jgi:hypothetical protein
VTQWIFLAFDGLLFGIICVQRAELRLLRADVRRLAARLRGLELRERERHDLLDDAMEAHPPRARAGRGEELPPLSLVD